MRPDIQTLRCDETDCPDNDRRGQRARQPRECPRFDAMFPEPPAHPAPPEACGTVPLGPMPPAGPNDPKPPSPAADPPWMGEAVEAMAREVFAPTSDAPLPEARRRSLQTCAHAFLSVARSHGWELRPVPTALDAVTADPPWMNEAVEAAGRVLISVDEDTVRDAILDAICVAREHGWELTDLHDPKAQIEDLHVLLRRSGAALASVVTAHDILAAFARECAAWGTCRCADRARDALLTAKRAAEKAGGAK